MILPGKEKAAIDLFMQEKPKNILIYLKKENKPVYISIISKEVNTTYSHTFNVLNELEKLKLVYFKESGRVKLVKLTELGYEVANLMTKLIELLSLGEIEKELAKTYETEIKGKLREQMNKEKILKQINKLKEKLSEFDKDKDDNVSILSKKLLKRMDDILAEVLGYPLA